MPPESYVSNFWEHFTSLYNEQTLICQDLIRQPFRNTNLSLISSSLGQSVRLSYKKNGYIRVQSGAGIVADSIPENEFQECLNKAGAVLQAVETAKGGLE